MKNTKTIVKKTKWITRKDIKKTKWITRKDIKKTIEKTWVRNLIQKLKYL